MTAEGIMMDGCAVAIDALRTLSRHQCARDLVEEFVCANVLPLRANKSWFAVRDDEKYCVQVLKGLGLDVKQAWAKVLRKSNIVAASVKVVYKKVAEAAEELIGALGNAENKAIKIALANRHGVNHYFDLLGLVYLDWPSMESKDVDVGKKRKRSTAGDVPVGSSKRGGRGQGRTEVSKAERVVAPKVALSSLLVVRLVEKVPMTPRPSAAGGGLSG